MTAPENTSAPADVRKLAREIMGGEKGRKGTLWRIAEDRLVENLWAFIQADRAAHSDQGAAEAVVALQPFADAVFNDNGDMTVDASFPKYDDFVRAYFVHKRLSRAALSPREATPARPEAIESEAERLAQVLDISVGEARRGLLSLMEKGLVQPVPEADDERVRREAIEERIREDERDRLFFLACQPRSDGGLGSQDNPIRWMKARDCRLPKDRALLRKGGA